MKTSLYINQRKELYNNILLFLDSNDNIEEMYGNLEKSLKNKTINSNKNHFELTLKMINKITKKHHRSPDFIKKIRQIMDLIVENFKKYYFSSFKLFKIFHNNKLILLYLFNSDIVEIDSSIMNYINYEKSNKSSLLKQYFMKEILIYNGMEKELKDFEAKRQNGENDSYICWLIRNDSIEEFVTYVNQTNISLSSNIEQSIYETNDFILKRKETTLIEYSAFCGSIQIFKFLLMNNVQMTPSLWLYAIHGRNPEIIVLLEENKIIPLDPSFIQCFIESIKCHHNEITQYIIDNYLQHFENFMNYFYKYYNFDFISNKVTMKNIQYFVKNSYYPIVKSLLKKKVFDLNTKIILNFYFFNPVFAFIPSQHFSFIKFAAVLNDKKMIKILLASGKVDISEGEFKQCGKLEKFNIPSYIKEIKKETFYECSLLNKITFPPSLESIGNHAFYKCFSLTQLSIPPSTNFIGDYSFYRCTSLEKITVLSPEISIGNNSFEECSSLKLIENFSYVKQIGNFAFRGCSSLEELTRAFERPNYDQPDINNSSLNQKILQSSNTSFGDYAFYDCHSLKYIPISSSVTSFGKSCFENCSSLKIVTITPFTNKLDDKLFCNCSSLEEIEIPSSVNLIGKNCFEKCIKLKRITIPPSVTILDDYLFCNCSSLKEIEIPSSVNLIGKSCFEKCIKLKRITIPPSVTILDDKSFHNCTSIEEINIPSSVNSIGKSCFEKCTYLKRIKIPSSVTILDANLFYDCTSIEEIDIPSSLKVIGEYCFYNCHSLKKMSIPNSVESIQSHAFYECSSITDISLPDTLTSIEDNTFNGCVSLTNISLPPSLEEIKFGAFIKCISIKSISLYSNVSIDSFAFYGCKSLSNFNSKIIYYIGEDAFTGCTSLKEKPFVGDGISSLYCNIY